MSLSSSISNALSGLSVSSRAAHLVSSNLANAMNENYSRQEIELGSSREGGATIAGVSRVVDTALLADGRSARAGMELSSGRADGARALEDIIGTPDDPSSLPAHVNRFDAALRFLEGDPGSRIRLQEVASSASALSNSLGVAQASIQSQRLSADRQISQEIKVLNASLEQIVKLNGQILSANVNGRDTNVLLDQRQSLVDQVSALVPVREMPRAHGAVSLVSATGMMLLESTAVAIEFTRTNQILPHMTLEDGQLGGISIDGEQVSTTAENGPFAGGRLQALFEIRDEMAPKAQDKIDAFALDLAVRFQDIPADGSIGVGDPGLFTDSSARAEFATQTGLAGRLLLNANVDPQVGGEPWRLRSGLNAGTEGAPGTATLIANMISSLSNHAPDAGSIFDHAVSLTSFSAQLTSNHERQESFSSAQFEQMTQLKLQNGVDTDAELQKLLVIETNYAANARVLQAIDEMFDTLMRMN